jgi:hypothetical protein
MRHSIRRAAVASLVGLAGCGWTAAHAADLTWEVVNPFRFYKDGKPFALQEAAFRAVRGDPNSPVPADIIRRVERCLNDPDPAGEGAAACGNLDRSMPFNRQHGWAASTLDDTCYNRSAHPRRYDSSCRRDGQAEDYVMPASHAVSIALSSERAAEAGAGLCEWSWKARSGGGSPQSASQPCGQPLQIAGVPYAKDRAASGVEVEVALPNGTKLAQTVIVEDLFVVALGDSFASGEGNPDRPVTFSNTRAINYFPVHGEVSAAADKGAQSEPNLAGRDDGSYVLPKRVMRDEETGAIYNYNTPQFTNAFWERSAAWLSPDCHRSQYAFPSRVAMQIVLEDRHRAVTFATFGCSGASVVSGLFEGLPAREHWDRSPNKTRDVASQFDQLTALICKTGTRVTTNRVLRVFAPGSTGPNDKQVTLRACPPNERKREIDVVLLSVGGNDVGFGQIAAYSFLDSVGDIAAVAKLREGQLRFPPTVGDIYLGVLDSWLGAVRTALEDGFGVEPKRVVHVSYEQALNDEQGRPCGQTAATATAGLDVHSKFRFDAGRVREAVAFTTRVLDRLQCSTQAGDSCHGRLPAGGGTGFNLVVEHQPEFLKRGMCARDAHNPELMKMARLEGSNGFRPYLPGAYRPYAYHERLFRTPNDAFLTANEHKGDETPIIDILQPAIAALYSGAFHPSAYAHALVADYVMPHVRKVIERGVAAADRP